jgi:pimeloyl-ACP methyl ester carboxylesterase
MKLTVDGREAYAYTGGKPFDPALPCTVLVHGALNDHSVWALQSRSLAHHGRSVLAVDLPGHGRSQGPALPSVEATADWLLALLAAAGVQRATLAGHSMGSLIALEAAARSTTGGPGDTAPDGPAVERLVMIGTAFPMKVSPALLETALTAPLRAIDQVNAFSISTLAAKPSNPGPGTWLHGANRALMRRLQAGYAAAGHGNLFHHDFSVCDRYTGGLEAAARVRCPTRLVLGGKDAMTLPKAAQAMATALKAEVRLLPSGHALMGESPDAVLDAVM